MLGYSMISWQPNDPAFKRRGFSVELKVTEIISYLKIKLCGASTRVRLETLVMLLSNLNS